MTQHRLIAGVFDSEENILAAANAARRAGYPVQDAFTPYPVHGMDHALGLAPSPLPKYCFRFGTAGLLLTLAFQYWVSLYDWPMNIGGKSFNASPALIPVAFELTVLFASLGTVASFLALRRMSPMKKPALPDLRGIDDRFVLTMRLHGEGAGAETMGRFLKEHGAVEIREVEAQS
jgi:hypothetical protein